MIEMLQKLCELKAVSGREDPVRSFILNEIGDSAECSVDQLGNIIAFKKGKQPAPKRIMLDAHMDEVGIIATAINDDGSIRFSPVGGINIESLISKRFVFENGTVGVVSAKPVHLLSAEEKKSMPKKESLVIDIGAKDADDCKKYISLGDTAVFDSDFIKFGDGLIKARAIDDRAGCAVLLKMIKDEIPYDMYFSFSVQEEVGLRGAHASAYGIRPDYAIAVEATTAVDIAGVSEKDSVCCLKDGAVLSFMDGRTVYDRALYKSAFEIAKANDIKCQAKAAVAGGNNAGSIHTSGSGVRTLAISVPCRYLHTADCVISEDDLDDTYRLVSAVSEKMAAGEI